MCACTIVSARWCEVILMFILLKSSLLCDVCFVQCWYDDKLNLLTGVQEGIWLALKSWTSGNKWGKVLPDCWTKLELSQLRWMLFIGETAVDMNMTAVDMIISYPCMWWVVMLIWNHVDVKINACDKLSTWYKRKFILVWWCQDEEFASNMMPGSFIHWLCFCYITFLLLSCWCDV
jgi:hypothetical protein